MDHDLSGPPAPPRVPGLQLLRVLGRGAHGEVWAAIDRGSGEKVAVKLHRASPRGPDRLEDDADAALRVAREISFLRRIEHPHVVRLRRVLDLPDGSRALVLDHAEGGNLADLVRARGRLSPGEVTTLLVGLARALADLHGRGVVHGDLSPGNVLFTGDGRPLLSDLGLGAVLGADPRESSWQTPGFTDPAGTTAGNSVRDVWGLGAVAWFAVTGRPPGAGGRSLRGIAGLGQESGFAAEDPLTSVRRTALVELILRCLDGNPERRPAAADVARLAWRCVPPAAIRLPFPATGVVAAADSNPGAGSGGEGAGSGGEGAGSGGKGAGSGGEGAGSCSGRVLPGPWLAQPAAAGSTIAWCDADERQAFSESAACDQRAGGLIVGDLAVGEVSNAVDEPDDEIFFDVTRRVRDEAGVQFASGWAPCRRWGWGWGWFGRRTDATGSHPASLNGVGLRRRSPGLAAAAWAVVALGAAIGGAGLAGAVAAGDDTGKGTSSGTVTSSNARGRGTGGGSPDSGGVMASAGRPFPGAATASGSVSECDAAEPAAQGFAEVVCALAQARAAAITSASLAALAKVDQPGSAALAADAALVRRLVERGLRLQGVGFVITGVRVVAQSPGSVTLTASVATRAHRQVRMDGSLVAEVPASPARTVRLVLVSNSGESEWLVRAATNA